MTDRAIPQIPTADIELPKKFYRYFGFEEVAREEGRWILLRCDGIELMFHQSSLDFTQDSLREVHRGCVITVEDAQAWRDKLLATRMDWRVYAPSISAMNLAAWDGRPAFCITDKEANLIWFVERLRSA